MQKLRLLIYHVILPISFGILIYLFFRSKSIIVFRWLDVFENSNQIESLRNFLFQYNSHLPSWLIFSLPDGLWVYALTSTLFIVWGKDFLHKDFLHKDFLHLKLWLIVSILIGPLLEFLQFLKLFPGTFDFKDLLFYLIGSILSLTMVKHNLIKNEQQNF